MPAFVFFALIGLGLFGWTIWKGVDLWRGLTEGYRWGKILFAAQIVKIDTPRFSYEFFTGLRLNWMFGQVKKRFSFDLGYLAEIYFAAGNRISRSGLTVLRLQSRFICFPSQAFSGGSTLERCSAVGKNVTVKASDFNKSPQLPLNGSQRFNINRLGTTDFNNVSMGSGIWSEP